MEHIYDNRYNRCYFAEDIIEAKPISQMHIINFNMNYIHTKTLRKFIYEIQYSKFRSKPSGDF